MPFTGAGDWTERMSATSSLAVIMKMSGYNLEQAVVSL